MGCGQSKVDTQLIKFCRERKDLIKASSDSLHSLAHAHKECMQSLQNFENEIRNFTREALVICFKSPLDTVPFHQTVEEVPNSKDSSFESDADDGVLSLTEYVNGGLGSTDIESENMSETSSKEASNSINEQPLVQPTYVTSFTEQPHNRYSDDLVKFFPGSVCFPQASSGFEFPQRSHISVDDSLHSFPGASEFTNHESWEYSNQHGNFPQHNQSYNYVSVPSNPPYPDVTTQDLINPFNSTKKNFPNFYFQGRYDTNVGSHYIDLSEVREREGMSDPVGDLRDPTMDASSDEEDSNLNEDSDDYLSGEAVNNGVDVRPYKDVTSIGNLNVIENKYQESRSSSFPTESVELKKIDNSEIRRELEESNLNEMSKVEAHVTQQEVTSVLDLQEVIGNIKDTIDTIIIHWKNVLEMLEPYQPRVTVIKRASFKGTSVLRCVMFRRRACTLMSEHHADCGTETSRTLFSLSWTLEKLSTWENKLYDEVKDEEKLREVIDKEMLKLKSLEHRGAESFKIDARQSLLKRLAPRMNVAMSKIEGISRATHQITNNELQPQLCEFIQRLHKMSKLSYESHQKQVQAISRSHANIDKITCMTMSSSETATEKLETETRKLETTFSCWIKTHKTLVILLKKWLGKFQDQKEVSDSNPSSPISLSTPNVSTICNEWLNALEKVSDVEVSLAFKNFTLILNQLRATLQEERCQRLKIEYLSNYHEEKFKKFCKKNGFDWDQYASLFREADLTADISGHPSLDALYASLRPVTNKLHEAAVRHEEAMKQVNDTAAGIFQNGLIPVFEALERFNLQMFQAYEQVRILNEGNVR